METKQPNVSTQLFNNLSSIRPACHLAKLNSLQITNLPQFRRGIQRPFAILICFKSYSPHVSMVQNPSKYYSFFPDFGLQARRSFVLVDCATLCLNPNPIIFKICYLQDSTELTPTMRTPGSPSPECAGARCARSPDSGSVRHRARVRAPQNSTSATLLTPAAPCAAPYAHRLGVVRAPASPARRLGSNAVSAHHRTPPIVHASGGAAWLSVCPIQDAARV
ncbi:hypothetical protein C8R47DRAFT_530038 [Mycena vitilis]|nr:hypothetical protein C8R47DRAFT_530038 [Mycena vitilis]